jgi:hypothetical protein
MPQAALRNPIVVAILFALSGLMTFGLLNTWNPGFYIGGVTFGLLAVILFARPGWMWLVIIALINVVWIAAWRNAVFLITNLGWNSYAGMIVSGIIGGIGVTAAAGIGRRSLLAMQPMLVVAVAGAIASLPFGWWEQKNTDSALPWCFAIWQCVAGVTLWACASRTVPVADPKPA